MFKKQNKQKTSRSSLLFFQFHFRSSETLDFTPQSPFITANRVTDPYTVREHFVPKSQF